MAQIDFQPLDTPDSSKYSDVYKKIYAQQRMNNPGEPDAFSKNSADSAANDAVAQSNQKTSAGEAALEHYGNVLTAQHLPQLQSVSQGMTDKLFGLITGKKVDPQNYVDSRDQNIARIQKEGEEHPYASAAGTAAGLINTSMMIPGGALKGAGDAAEATGLLGTGVEGAGSAAANAAPGFFKNLVTSGVKGAIAGAGYGAIQNPGDVKGKVDPLQIDDRTEGAERGAKFGAVAGPVSYGVSKGLGALADSADGAKGMANTSAIKAAGGMLKDFREIDGRDQTQEFGQFLRDNNLVEAGDTVKDVSSKAAELQQSAGEALDSIYSKAKEASIGGNVPGFNPVRDKDAIMQIASDKLGNEEGGPAALKRLSDYLDAMGEKHGNKDLDPRTANDIKSAVDRTINYSRNPLAKQPDAETAFAIARKAISNKIDEGISKVGEATNNPQMLNDLKQANQTYGFAKKTAQMAGDYVNRGNANRMFGLTDTITGAGGAIAGGAAGAATGDHSGKNIAEGAALGLLAGGANKLARTYGPGALSGLAGTAEPILRNSVVPAAESLSQIPQSNMMSAAIQGGLLKDQNTNAPKIDFQEIPGSSPAPITTEKKSDDKRKPSSDR